MAPESNNQKKKKKKPLYHHLWVLGGGGVNSGGLTSVLLPSPSAPPQLLGLPDLEDDSFEHYHADMEGEPGPDHQQMGVSQQ